MKKFVIKLLAFVVFAFLLYICILPLWSSIMPPFLAKNVRNCVGCYGHLFTRSREATTVENPDILFLGSSHAYRGFDPRIFSKKGYKTFNLGSSAQTPVNTHVLLKQYLDKVKPKMVVYEVYAGTLEMDGVESSLDLLSNAPIDRNSANMAIHVNNLMTYNTFIFGAFRQLFKLNKNMVEERRLGDDLYVSGGYVQTDYRVNPMKDLTVKKWKISSKQLHFLKENVKLIEEKKIPVFLVQAPISSKMYRSKTNNAEIDSIFASIAPYKNFYGALQLNDTVDFYDSDHLNQTAVEKFNYYFIDYLKSRK